MRYVLSVLLLTFIGCVSASPEASKVRVTANSQATAGCRFLVNVSVSNVMGGDDTERRLQNEGVKVGADVVYVSTQNYRGIEVRGEAYRCGP